MLLSFCLFDVIQGCHMTLSHEARGPFWCIIQFSVAQKDSAVLIWYTIVLSSGHTDGFQLMVCPGEGGLVSFPDFCIQVCHFKNFWSKGDPFVRQGFLELTLSSGTPVVCSVKGEPQSLPPRMGPFLSHHAHPPWASQIIGSCCHAFNPLHD